MFSSRSILSSTGTYSADINKLKNALAEADAVIIGAGAGLSTAAGFTYDGQRFRDYFADFAAEYGFGDMYAGGFYPYSSPEELWAFWSRNIYINRYMETPLPVYDDLFSLLRDKDYFVITTNVDHCFQKAGFAQKRLFYTQGDYGLWQCSEPCHQQTYDNEDAVRKMVLAQGFTIGENGKLLPPAEGGAARTVPTELIPRCPRCGKPMKMNLRSDETFVEDEGWHLAAERYEIFLRSRRGKILFWELGVGYNTPAIIKFPFWSMTAKHPDAVYACVNNGQAACPAEIGDRAICINSDIGKVLLELKQAGR